MTHKEIVDFYLSNQEWQTFECKRAKIQPSKLLETVVAFLNTDGGVIVLGMDDPEKAKGKDRLIGISEGLDNISEFLKLIEKEIDPQIKNWEKQEISIINVYGKKDTLLLFSIPKSDDIHSLKKGDTFARKGRQNSKLTATEIVRLKYEKGSLKFEDEHSGIDRLEEINQELVEEYKSENDSRNKSNWQFLKDNGLALRDKKGFHLTKGGVLLFSRNPSVSLRGKYGVKISHYYGTRELFTGEPNFVRKPFTIEGCLFSQIEKTMEYFQEVAKSYSVKLRGAAFSSNWLIPEWAFQEAVVNAVIHRNYAIQNDIQVRFFDDRVEIESPGSYPGHVTANNIRSERFARNPLILRKLNRFSSAPNLDIGEGVDRMFTVMKEHNLYEPIYMPPSLRPNSVMVVLLNFQKVAYWDIVSNFLDKNYKITNIQARKITGIRDSLTMTRLLKELIKTGLLEMVGGGFKGSFFYKKPGVEIPSFIFKMS